MKRIRSISPSTRICAVIGNPIAHSLSPAIHNAAIEELGLDFVYVAFRVEDVKNALYGMKALDNFRGMSVTIPHKVEIMKYMDEIDPVDMSIGSINTVLHEEGKLKGFGTDGPGALQAITDAGVNMTGKKVLMLGSGGAARAISFNLARHAGLESLLILDINEPMLNELTSDLKKGTNAAITFAALNDVSLAQGMEDADIIIHCTPIGMHPKDDVSLIPPDLFRHEQVVFDVVYTPLKTKLLSEAGSRGLKVISGVEMFIHQAVLQFERFTGAKAPVEVMRRVVMEHLSK